MAMFKIRKQDGTVVELPNPKTATFTREDIDASETGRNQLGKMFRYRVATKGKWTNAWGPLTPAQVKTILDAIEDEWFYLIYHDAKDDAEVEKEYYAGPQSMPILWWNPIAGKRMYSGLTVNFIEM